MTESLVTLGEKLRQQTAAVRLFRESFWLRRRLSTTQTEQAANVFGAERTTIGANKRLLNSRHSTYRKVTHYLTQARAFWIGATTPYPERGIRLIRRDRIEYFEGVMNEIKADLHAAVADLDTIYRDELIPQARAELGELFDERDYPTTLTEQFGLSWDWPSIEPPDYLRELHPTIWEQARANVSARFEQARVEAEREFAQQLGNVMSHLVDRLTPNADGTAKIYRDSSVKNLFDFLERYKNASVVPNPQLDALVEQAKSAVAGVDVSMLRDSSAARQYLADQAQAITEQLDLFLVDRPERAIDFNLQ